MKAGRKKQILSDREASIMRLLWDNGPLYVKEMVRLLPEPRPHVNTISTMVKILEEKGYVTHKSISGSYQYSAIVGAEGFCSRSLADVVLKFFNNSYKNAVSALVAEEKISVEELREIIGMVERQHGGGQNKEKNN